MGRGRAPCCDKSKVKKGPWSPAEDLRLIAFVQKHGHSNWRALPKQAGLLRCGKSCRLRWINYLRPDVKRGNFTTEEEETIIKLHNSMGNKWSKIASHFPGRTDNEIKNVWNTHLKKRVIKRDKDGGHENEIKNMQKLGLGIDDDQDDRGILVAQGKEYYNDLTAKTGQCNMIDETPNQQSGFDSLNSSYASSHTTFSSLCCCTRVEIPRPKELEINSIHDLLDEAFEIPLQEPGVEAFWNMLDTLDFANKSTESESHACEVHRYTSNTSGEGLDDPQVACREWLKILEYELGLLEESRDAHDNQRRDSNDRQHLVVAETAFNDAVFHPPDIDIIDNGN